MHTASEPSPLLVALEGGTERAAPQDDICEVPVGNVGVVLVPACLELLDEVDRRLFRPLCSTDIAAERRTDRLGFVGSGSDIERLKARMVRIDVHTDHPARVDADDVRAQACTW